jgi:UDP-2-acetamido-2-deoxy-ribo-hexuluronate aminotransferase
MAEEASTQIQMVDLQSQYQRLQHEIDSAIKECLLSGQFIQGAAVRQFEQQLAAYTGTSHVISCANGTDALQLAMMALNLPRGSKVLVPAFTYIATVEVLLLLGLQPVYADVEASDFMVSVPKLEQAWQDDCRALMVVHLFGQCPDMESILEWADFKGIPVIEDNAQSIGCVYQGREKAAQAGTLGLIGTTSFFPSKNLGCYGDGGALFTNDESMALKLRMLANHGQSRKYIHDIVGINSRLDALQAAILQVKLQQLDAFIDARQAAAAAYDERLKDLQGVHLPHRNLHSSHVFHQYTLRTDEHIDRDALQQYLTSKGIPTGVYYPLPVYAQKAYQQSGLRPEDFPITEHLCRNVISLPMHTELTAVQIDYICDQIKAFVCD